jgi:uncharacterized protein (DUF362 family)
MKRRDFIRNSFLIGAGFTFLPHPNPWRDKLRASPVSSRIIDIENPNVLQNSSVDINTLEKMLDGGISELYQTDDPQQVWNNLFSRKDVVGLKVNCLSGKHASTHQELVKLVIERLRKTGIEAGNIIIWDRLNQDLESANYKLNTRNKSRVRCLGNDAVGYDNQLYINGSVGSLITRTMTQLCTATINLPVLKDHGIVGVTISMKNFFGAIHNPNKYHHNAGDPFVADLYELDMIRRKTRLTICDALTAQYEGGPPFKPQWSWQRNSLLIGVDGVALDRVGWEIIEQKREEMDVPSLKKVGREPKYIITAGEKKLGISDINKIEWKRLNL